MGFRENDGFGFRDQREGMGLSGARILLPDFERLLDLDYVKSLAPDVLARKVDRIRDLHAQPNAAEVEGFLRTIGTNLLRALFYQRTEGLLPDLQLIQDARYLSGYSADRLQKLLICLDSILGEDLDFALREQIVTARGLILRVSAAAMEDAPKDE